MLMSPQLLLGNEKADDFPGIGFQINSTTKTLLVNAMSLTGASPEGRTEHEDERLTIILADGGVAAMSECPTLEPAWRRRSSGKRGLGGVGVHAAKAELTWERSK